jgi:nucleotide-binding universal stress UspA family protein
MYDDILIPTDGRDATLDAVAPGLELASQHGATVHALCVVENRMLPTALAPASLTARVRAAREAGERAVAALESLAHRHDVETVSWVLRSRPTLVAGCAHEVIVEYAETHDVDLIVMGSTGRGRLSTFLRPSVTQRVMALTDVPVHGRRRPQRSEYVADRSLGSGPRSGAGD